MNRSGFALLSVLWITTLLIAAASLGSWLAWDVILGAQNRAILTRADWARDACGELLRWPEQWQRLVDTKADTIDLGSGLWCSMALEDPRARLGLLQATPRQLLSVIGSDSLVSALIDWIDPDDAPLPTGAESQWYRLRGLRLPRNGPPASVGELRFVRGWSDSMATRLAQWFTVAGDGVVNLNQADPEILSLVPGLTREAIELIVARRLSSRPLQSSEELLGLLSSESRVVLLQNFREFSRSAAWQPDWWVVTLHGWVNRQRPTSTMHLWIRSAPGSGLAVLRREVE